VSAKPTTAFLLLLGVIVTCIGVVYARHEGRKQFVELQALGYERDRMDVEWGQLQLEQSTLTTQGRVENAARGRLDMISPAPDQMVILKP
jgi:cell division protein FtsL